MRYARLVVVSKISEDPSLYQYTRYEGRVRDRRYHSPEPLEQNWVEVIRDAPEVLDDEEPEDQGNPPPSKAA